MALCTFDEIISAASCRSAGDELSKNTLFVIGIFHERSLIKYVVFGDLYLTIFKCLLVYYLIYNKPFLVLLDTQSSLTSERYKKTDSQLFCICLVFSYSFTF